ncbi:DNA polymerase III subunit alpha [Nocardiopsis sp. RV163]|uniref:DNA polymerase III subunit alpha n=1 Tax=Nocardiopsis sp. RV163 TaxID=1661388 RepID=UPI00069F45C2|nr:DNA polymerase III subunit alpha [Nocardiopsis sp. RV163]
MFAHLRTASNYSFRHGTAAPAALVARAAADDQPVAALTDRDSLFGAAEHVHACREAGIRPVLGADLALAAPGGGRAVLLARGPAGWASLCRLVTAAHHRPGPVATTPDEVAEHARGLVVLLGPDSDVGRALAGREASRARALLLAWRSTGAEIALAPHDHGAPGQRETARALVSLADDHRVLAVLTNAVRYPAPADASLARSLDRIRQWAPGGYTPDPPTDRAHPATGAEMLAVATAVCAGDRSRARRLLAHTAALAASCALDPAADLGMGRLHLPARPGAAAELRARCASGAARLGMDGDGRAPARLEAELAVIDRLGLWSYFLTVADAADAVRAKHIRVSARGSAAGSLVVHLLGISAVNPLEHGLLMERFLTPSRPGQPDIDLDVESARRLEAYDAVIAAHPGAAAAVAMVDTYRARSALRDAGAALSLPSAEVERIAAAFPRVRAARIRQAARELPELSRVGGAPLAGEHVERLFTLAERLDGLPRHLAMHPCGLVLTGADLTSRVPTQPSGAGYPMVQADKDGVEPWGLLKLDVLGVRMQSTLAHAQAEIARTTRTAPDLEALPDADAATAHMIAAGNTLSCYQIESPGQRSLVTRLRPRRLADLVADISLFRPGPMGVDMVAAYLDGRAGAPAPAPHPCLDPVLAETGGALLWHEQLLQVLDAYTGCGLDRAEAMRRALATDQGRAQVEAEVRTLAAQRGHPTRVTDQVWEMIAAFGAFGFCRAHGTAFAAVTYQSAYLKRHHPAAFTAGVMEHHPGMYPRRVLLQDARRTGVPVLGLDVNASHSTWRVARVGSEGPPRWGVRPPLDDVSSLPAAAVEQILARRPFTGLEDVLERTDLSGQGLDDLILAGGLDSLVGGHAHRRDALLRAHVLRRPRAARTARGQLALTDASARSRPAGAVAVTRADAVAEELRVLGYELSGHLLDAHAEDIARLAAHHRLTLARDLHRWEDGATVTVAGLRVSVQTPPTRSGRRMVFATLEDRTGLVDLALSGRAQRHSAAPVFGGGVLVARGRVRRAAPGALATVDAADVRPLGEVVRAPRARRSGPFPGGRE